MLSLSCHEGYSFSDELDAEPGPISSTVRNLRNFVFSLLTAHSMDAPRVHYAFNYVILINNYNI